MRAGAKTPQLNRLLRLQARVHTPDGVGGSRVEWQDLGQVWAKIEVRSGGVGRGDGGDLAQINLRILVRALPQNAPLRPRPDQRFCEGSRVFRILAVADHDQSGRYLICFAKEEVAA